MVDAAVGASAEPAPAHTHLTWLRCPACRRPLAPLYVVDGQTILEPTPHIQVTAARLVCPRCQAVREFISELKPNIQKAVIMIE
jgi:uncharacterized protein YbaR (Trm112 family)